MQFCCRCVWIFFKSPHLPNFNLKEWWATKALINFRTPCWIVHLQRENVAGILDMLQTEIKYFRAVFFRAIYTYAVAFLESEPSHTAQNTEFLPEMINISHFSFLICLHFANITSHPLPLTSSGYYQQAAKKSFPSNVSATYMWEIFSPMFSVHIRHDLQKLVIWGLIMEV